MLSTVLLSILLASLASSTPFVEKCHGRDVSYEGIHRDEVETFLGIPYGRDTSGMHRFKAPRPFSPRRRTTIRATAAGPACPQSLGGSALPLSLGNVTEISEDCLHLNVYRPNGTQPGDRLPVLLFIHGGSFVSASKDEPTLQPSGLILQSVSNGHPVMAVNINYRLGVFGFAKSEALSAEKSLNAGLKDQRLAIEWVSKNIASFGGDPEKITIYGQSSGGLAVGAFIAMKSRRSSAFRTGETQAAAHYLSVSIALSDLEEGIIRLTSTLLALGNVTEISEDCLHLNVYRPNGTQPGDRLPVLLFIHGGSFVSASKDEPTLQPSGLILQSVSNGHPVMAVNINYRLGVFGFAKSEALSAEKSLNAGLKDQRLAIEWVSKNIASFGGDPEKITIYGQSSGGLAVGMQIMAYGGSGPALFHQAICESQALEPGITGEFTNTAMANMVNASKCGVSDIQSKDTISCLRGLSMSELLELQTATYDSGPASNVGDSWLPTVDGHFLPAAPSTLIAEGRFSSVPTMMGWCEDDTTIFVDPTIRTANDTSSFFSDYLPGMSSAHLHDLLALYPVSDFPSNPAANHSAQFYRAGRILRDILMVCEPLLYGEALAKAGNPVYFYDQNQTLLTNVLASAGEIGVGVVHTSEFAYIFGNLSHYDVPDVPFQPSASDFALLKRESRSWSSFASQDKPSLWNHDTLQGWETAFAAEREDPGVFIIGGPQEGFAHLDEAPLRQQKLKERCGFINRPEIVKDLQY
nr:secreted lipase [Quercus suber]